MNARMSQGHTSGELQILSELAKGEQAVNPSRGREPARSASFSEVDVAALERENVVHRTIGLGGEVLFLTGEGRHKVAFLAERGVFSSRT